MHKLLLTGSILVALAGHAEAVVLVTPGGSVDVGRFSLEGDALAQGAFTPSVTVHSQGLVDGLFSPSGAAYGNLGLNQSFQITYLIGFGETQSVGPDGELLFALNPANPVNYFRLYISTTPDANFLLGTGFANGTLVLSGHLTQLGSVFGFTPVVGPLDEYDPNNYPGVLSVTGSGVDKATIVVDSVDAAAFPDGVRGLLDAIAPNDFPFTFLNPSQQYQTPTGTLTPDIGAYNGAGPDLVLELHASLAVVPEPGSLALLATGIAIAVGARRRVSHTACGRG
jgi:PEP-CTERM motif